MTLGQNIGLLFVIPFLYSLYYIMANVIDNFCYDVTISDDVIKT